MLHASLLQLYLQQLGLTFHELTDDTLTDQYRAILRECCDVQGEATLGVAGLGHECQVCGPGEASLCGFRERIAECTRPVLPFIV
jgi:hypothetical protein